MDYIRKLHKYRFFRFIPKDTYTGSIVITDLIDSFNRGMGVSMFKRDWNLCHLVFVFGNMILTIYLISVFYTGILYRREITKLIFCVSTFGFGIQALVKIIFFVFKRSRVLDLNEVNLRYYKTMLHESERVRRVICENITLSYIVVKGTFYIYLAFVVASLVIPGLASFFLPERILPFGFILPFVDPDSFVGYVLNYCSQSIAAYYYWRISAGSDCTIVFNLLTASGQLDGLMTLIDELNDQLESGEAPAAIRKKIVKIIQQHQYHRDYLSQLMDFLYLYHIGSVGFGVLTMIISVMGIVLLDWYLGAICTVMGSVQLFYLCFLSTSFEIKTDTLIEHVGAIKWDKLSSADMKYMNLLLLTSQSPKLLEVFTTPLNISSYVQIHKMIYTMIMMLQNTKS
ncbi:uncharacterized protein LOC128277363 [Anopheles cruzii]|uniref:uncharacterized protein LOC128277363 n=1 Tax=Anopheles cruzii TaxID=68878 RepID=UPI0022EC1D5D|nr:uncharacterized protein LOC128277363 [Anopheles cruzii]